MSRSFRKNPFRGLGGSSEKDDKRRNNRKLRKKSKLILKEDPELDTKVLPIMNEVSDLWNMSKDGKILLDKNNKKDMRK